MDDKFIDNNDFINSAKKKRMLFILVVDTSASMKNKIEIVNDAMKRNITKMKELDLSHNIAKVAITILEFDKDVRWIPEKPQEINNFNFIDIECSNTGQSNYSKLYQSLNNKLNKEDLLENASDYHPIILLISDGKPTDEYEDYLSECEENEWFHRATRIALPIITEKNMSEEEYRDSIDYECIMDFTCQKEEMIFMISNLDKLADILDIVTITTIKHENKENENDDDLNLDDPFNDIRNKILKIEI